MMKYLWIALLVLCVTWCPAADRFLAPSTTDGHTWHLGKETNQWSRIDVETSSLSPLGYAKGDAPYYVNTNTVTFSNGMMFCNGRLGVVTNQTFVFANLATAQDIHYVYNNFSASTFPSNMVFYDSTNEPTQRNDQGGGLV